MPLIEATEKEMREQEGIMDSILTIREAGQQYLERERQLRKQCRIEGNYLVLEVTCPYDIELERINTPERLLACIVHLCEKRWVTTLLIRRMIELVAAKYGFQYQGF